MFLTLAPIVALQLTYLWSKSMPWLAPAGIELAGMGVIGLAGTQVRDFLRRWPWPISG
jgi:hypothetical protein